MVLPDRLVFTPFGIWRGIFRDKVVLKDQVASAHPAQSAIFNSEGLVVERPLRGGVHEEIQFFPRGESPDKILQAMRELGYPVDLTHRRARLFG